MEIFEGTKEARNFPRPLVAIGVFDGVHRGHQAILSKLVTRSKEQAGTPMLLTFSPHPQKVIRPAEAPSQLQTRDQKQETLQALGLEVFIRMAFTRRLSLLSPTEFAQQVLSPLQPTEVHVGQNFRFGHRRAGDFETLLSLGRQFGFSVCSTEPICFRGERVSSTRVRQLVSGGRVALSKRLLLRPYEIRGTVIRGDGRGSDLGFPTANLETENELIPAHGVYATRAWLGDTAISSATNIGLRPTLRQTTRQVRIETHLIDFDENIYGRHLRLEFCLKLRSEKRFADLSTLVAQMKLDVAAVRRYARRISRNKNL